MFDLVFLELCPLNFRVTFTNNLRPLPVSFDVGSAALSTSVQNVVTRACEHVVSTFGTEVGSAALPTFIDTGRRRRLFMTVTRKFNGHNSRKTRSNISISKCMTSFFSSYDH